MSEKLTQAQKKLLSKLKRGDRKKIAAELGITYAGLWLALTGQSKNIKAWELVAAFAAENNAVEQSIIQAAENLSC